MDIDELIESRWIVPVEPSGVILEDHALALAGGKIVAIEPTVEARRHFRPARTTILPHHVLTPGLINLHTHAAMTLLRGIGDDLALMAWLEQRIWPVERALMSRDFVLSGTRLACAEMLRGGITCFNDMYFFPDAAAQAAMETGMRASLGITVIDFPTAWANDADDYLNKGLALRDELAGESRFSFCLAPHASFTVGDATFARIATLSDQLELPIHIHLHETEDEIRADLTRHGCRPLERIARLGLLGPQLIAVHAVHLTTQEIDLFARHGVSIAHCPTSNLKLASGIAPIARCLDAGVAVGIGTDSAASNNRLDLLSEMRLAALLAKGASGRADVLSSHQALHAATLAGATALGLNTRIGSLSVGKDGDIVAFDFDHVDMQPCFDPVSHLVYVAQRDSVSHVWVQGESVVQMRQFTKQTARDAECEGAAALPLWQNRVNSQIDSLS